MRVTFEHSQQGKGYLLIATIEFSEEEKVLIKKTGVGDIVIEAGAAAPEQNVVAVAGASLGMGVLSAGLILAGIVSIITAVTMRTGELLPFVFFGAAILLRFKQRKKEKHYESSLTEQTIPVKRLLNDPRIVAYTTDAASSQLLEASIHKQLITIKEMLRAETEIAPKKTYEI